MNGRPAMAKNTYTFELTGALTDSQLNDRVEQGLRSFFGPDVDLDDYEWEAHTNASIEGELDDGTPVFNNTTSVKVSY